jgi:hypothetical protein
MVNVLVSAGADMDFVDKYGNTILHLLVHHGLTQMYDHVVGLWMKQKGIDESTRHDNP